MFKIMWFVGDSDQTALVEEQTFYMITEPLRDQIG